MEFPIGEVQSLLLLEFAALPSLLENCQAQVVLERFFEDLILFLTASGCEHFGRSKKVLVNVNCGFSSGHIAILAENRLYVKAALSEPSSHSSSHPPGRKRLPGCESEAYRPNARKEVARLSNNAASNPLGIFNTVYARLSLEEMARAVQAHGFRHVHLDPRAPGILPPGAPLTADRARRVRQVLADHGISVAALAGYTNLVDVHTERREAGLRAFEQMIELCQEFGTPYIATETGSLNPESPWEDYPANHAPAAWEELLTVLRRLLQRARQNGVTILIEGYVNNVVATTEEAARLLADLGAEGLGFVLDPFNYFTRADVERPREALDRIFRAIAARAPIAHAKDVVYTDRGIATPKAGAGRMDWPAYAAMLRRHAPHIPLILEHLGPGEVEACKATVEAAFASR